MTATLPAPAPPAAKTRLDWLDGLRGYAALVVVLFHLSPSVLGSERHLAVFRVIDLGKYGVLLFFLVSGYVIPMSLERHGSLRRFWIGRLFRIYPAYLLAVVLVLVVTLRVPGGLSTERGLLAHATMLSDPLGVRGAVRPFWTLSYEMVFYLVVAGLFAWRLHRHSALWAAVLAAGAVVAAPVLPDGLFAGHLGVTAAVLLVLVAGCVAAFVTRRAVRAAGLVGIGFLLLVAVNGHPTGQSTVASSQQGLLLLAVMFAGTVVYRTQHGQIDGRVGVPSLLLVGLCVTASISWITVAAVAATFAAAFALRERRTPAALTWLGAISYSLYVLHVIVLSGYGRLVPDLAHRPPAIRLVVAAARAGHRPDRRLGLLPPRGGARRSSSAAGSPPGAGPWAPVRVPRTPDRHGACRAAHGQRRERNGKRLGSMSGPADRVE